MFRRLCRSTLFGSLLLCLLLLPALSTAASLTGRVNWVHDGDTIEVSGIGTVRLLGIDAPEREPSRRDRFYHRLGISSAALRKIHKEGKAYLICSIKGQTVNLATERHQRDRYNRLLAYVYLPDGQLLNQLLIEKGYAVTYRRFDFDLKDDFLAAEARARRDAQGLWRN